MENPLIDNLKRRLDETGRSARDVSLAVTGKPDTLRNILRGATRDPKAEVLAGIAKELGTTPDALLGAASRVARLPRREVRAANVAAPPLQAMPNDVPVRGTAAGSHLRGAFELEAGVIDWVRRPSGLAGATNAYALYIEGSSMVPEHNPGDLRFVHPDRPPRIGDSVIVQVKLSPDAPIEATIGNLIRRTERAVIIGKHSPKAEVELKRETVVAIHKVMTVNELFGV